MSKLSPKLKITKPKNLLLKPLSADFKVLFKALGKVVLHGAIGKWEEVGNDALETLGALGLATDPEELGFLLVQRSLTKAIVELVAESASHLTPDKTTDADMLVEHLGLSTSQIFIDQDFFTRPTDLAIIIELKDVLRSWLEAKGVKPEPAAAIVARLPSYFVYALNQEWRRNAKSYAPIAEAVNSPFTKATEREWAWYAYSAQLEKRTNEGIFDETLASDRFMFL